MPENSSASLNTSPPCDIVVPIHNAAHWVDWCLDEIIRHDSELIGRIFFVDDGSDPEQSELIKQVALRFHKVSYVKTPEPTHGFGVACNAGAALSSAPFLLFLNTDCLLTQDCIKSLLDSFALDPNIALSCPVSNNSPALTLPMIPGYSYADMNRLCQESANDESGSLQVLDACTVVGNCLMVRKSFFEKVGGFDSVWGKGYGEETDLHMKAFSLGLRGVVTINAYVYHFGSGTFRHEAEQEELKKRNYALFMSKWAKEYRLLAKHCTKNPPIPQLKKNIKKHVQQADPIELDVLLYLPALNQSIGGLHTVVAICNAMICAGLRVGCAVVGIIRQSGANAFQEPLLFECLHYPNNQSFLADKKWAPRIVISTLYSSASVVAQYALARGARHLQYIQGYEAYFEGGRCFSQFFDALQFGDTIITTSHWLEEMISRHIPVNKKIIRLPLGVNEFIFYPTRQKSLDAQHSDLVIGAVLRASPDKGQGMVLEIFDRLISSYHHHLVIFLSPGYQIPHWWPTDRYTAISLPSDQVSIARSLQGIDIFLDASLHEGFGLMPLEALACGCRVVCSDSGGIRDFVKNGVNGYIVKEVSDPMVYLQKIEDCRNLPPVELAPKFQNTYSLKKYVAAINELLESTRPIDKTLWQKKIANIRDLSLKQRLHGFLLKSYMKMLPRIPRRIHLALMALLGGLL